MTDTMAPFPVQADTPEPRTSYTCPRWLAELAYEGYRAVYPGSAAAQSLDRLGERMGFGLYEMLWLINEGRVPDPRRTDD